MTELHDKLELRERNTAAAASALASPSEACQKMRALKICPGYVYYPETDTEAYSCSDYCSCRMRIREAMKARRAAALAAR